MDRSIMCRDGFRTECEEPGCTNVVTCRDFPRMCRFHNIRWDDEEPYVGKHRGATDRCVAEDGTLGALRELTADLPDETRIEVAMRFVENGREDFAFMVVEGESYDEMQHRITLTTKAPEWI